jgi:hypothetical protein
MSGQKVGRRRTRAVIRPVALPALKPAEDATDTRTDRALGELADAVNGIIEKVQGNVDLGVLR